MPHRRTFALASWPSLTPWRLRFDILSALAAKAGSRGTGNPSPVHETRLTMYPSPCSL